MLKRILILLALSSLAVVYQNCGEGTSIETRSTALSSLSSEPIEEEPSEELPPSDPVSFSQAFDVLLSYCLGCHSSGNPSGGGVDLGHYNAILNYIVPGDAENSPLYQSIVQGRMPTNGQTLASEELALLKDWIDQGAPNP